MRYLLSTFALAALALTGSAAGQSADRPVPGFVRVRILTSDGPIVLALDARRAPRTTANFLAYVDDGRFDGTTFYRAARHKTAPGVGFIQGGIRTDARRILPPFPHEPTTTTGIRHLDATVSMARGSSLRSAGGNFVITAGRARQLRRLRGVRPGRRGHARGAAHPRQANGWRIGRDEGPDAPAPGPPDQRAQDRRHAQADGRAETVAVGRTPLTIM